MRPLSEWSWRSSLDRSSFPAANRVAGFLIASVSSGWVFLINAASFVAVLGSLTLPRVGELHLKEKALRTPGSFAEGFRYVWNRSDLKAVLLMLFLIGTFGLNFPIFISTMSVTVFHAGAGQYGFLTSTMAMGGRVLAILLAIALGGTPIGAPVAGWVTDRFGPRWALGTGAASGIAAAIVGILYLTKHCHLSRARRLGTFGVWTSKSYLGHGVRRDALLTAAGKPGRFAYGRG